MAFQSGAFQSGAFQAGGEAAVTAAAQAGGPRTKRRRGKFKQKHVITIDGKDYVVESLQEASALLAEAKEAVEEAVEEAAEEAKPVTVKLPRIRASGPKGPDLLALVELVSYERDMQREVFASVMRDAEIAHRMHELQEQDDEDAIFALLH